MKPNQTEATLAQNDHAMQVAFPPTLLERLQKVQGGLNKVFLNILDIQAALIQIRDIISDIRSPQSEQQPIELSDQASIEFMNQQELATLCKNFHLILKNININERVDSTDPLQPVITLAMTLTMNLYHSMATSLEIPAKPVLRNKQPASLPCSGGISTLVVLPFEIIVHIVDQLPWADRLVCRQVTSSFRNAVDVTLMPPSWSPKKNPSQLFFYPYKRFTLLNYLREKDTCLRTHHQQCPQLVDVSIKMKKGALNGYAALEKQGRSPSERVDRIRRWIFIFGIVLAVAGSNVSLLYSSSWGLYVGLPALFVGLFCFIISNVLCHLAHYLYSTYIDNGGRQRNIASLERKYAAFYTEQESLLRVGNNQHHYSNPADDAPSSITVLSG
ncbi:MAG: hypothetical protein A3F17_06695 [Gammaproteobacteria bacterium RIFCSPHIGHO2_12_FULL_41_15]|nr:MAG: hypothetical protein A3F17_06695 [Gammaproteobacteria bacterium RIFCSPHIGHO2_12_FULL_41_15]